MEKAISLGKNGKSPELDSVFVELLKLKDNNVFNIIPEYVNFRGNPRRMV